MTMKNKYRKQALKSLLYPLAALLVLGIFITALNVVAGFVNMYGLNVFVDVVNAIIVPLSGAFAVLIFPFIAIFAGYNLIRSFIVKEEHVTQ